MVEGTYMPGDGIRITPVFAVAANRLVDMFGEQAVAGVNCKGFAPDAIAAGTPGLAFDWKRGSYLVEAGALIAVNQYVMSDANGRVITYVAAPGVKVVGFCVTGASAATHKVEVFPLPPQP